MSDADAESRLQLGLVETREGATGVRGLELSRSHPPVHTYFIAERPDQYRDISLAETYMQGRVGLVDAIFS